MRVRAKKKCFASGARRRVGDVFDFTPRVVEGKPEALPSFLEEAADPVNTPEVIPPEVPGQAPSSGATPSPEAMAEGAYAEADKTAQAGDPDAAAFLG